MTGITITDCGMEEITIQWGGKDIVVGYEWDGGPMLGYIKAEVIESDDLKDKVVSLIEDKIRWERAKIAAEAKAERLAEYEQAKYEERRDAAGWR